MFKYRLSTHCKERMTERKINKDTLEKTIITGKMIKTDIPLKFKFVTKYISVIVVFDDETKKSGFILTVHRTNKSTMKKAGIVA